jgi:hypothetical protein
MVKGTFIEEKAQYRRSPNTACFVKKAKIFQHKKIEVSLTDPSPSVSFP